MSDPVDECRKGQGEAAHEAEGGEMSLLKYYTDLCPHEPEWVPAQLAEEAAAWQAEIKRLTALRPVARPERWDSLPRERQVELLEMRASEHRGQLQAVEAALAEMEATK